MIELGRQFGLYVIKEMIADSDTTVCCKAEDPFFNREVALKVYPAELFTTGETLAQIENLLERLAVLDHPSIAPVYDSGIEGEYYYYTSCCYYGGSLADQATGPISSERILKLAAELTQALAYAAEHGMGPGELSAKKIFFDAEGRAVISDFAIGCRIQQILVAGDPAEQCREKTHGTDSVEDILRSLGELLLRLALGPKADFKERIDDLLAEVGDPQLKKLLGRFLQPGEWRFASYDELLEELAGFAQLAPLLKAGQEKQSLELYQERFDSGTELPADEQTEQAVVEVRRLVAEKNNLQQSLDKAIYDRNIAENNFSERMRELTAAQTAAGKAQEEANVAWELVAGQKYDRWRPVVWAVGGFVVGFILSGSYGYYYSEQTRNELLAKLQANEELIKSAAWRSVEHSPAAAPEKQSVAVLPAPPAAGTVASQVATVAVAEKESVSLASAPVIVAEPVKEVAQQWWPVGSEFSPTAAIPVEQIKAALGLESLRSADGLSEMLREEVLSVLGGWADSWSKQDLVEYLSFYSDDYRPELGRSQGEWRELRRSRLSKPKFIELNLDDISLRKIDDTRIQVKLKQVYRSDFYQDQILKSINLIKENGSWRILMERSLGMVDDIVGG